MRGRTQEDFTLEERFGDEPELELLEIAQTPVNKLAAGRAGLGAKVSPLHQNDTRPAACRIARDADAVDAAADDEEIGLRLGKP
jgi:hypothetical protein